MRLPCKAVADIYEGKAQRMSRIFTGDDSTPNNIQRNNIRDLNVHFNKVNTFDLAEMIDDNGIDHLWMYDYNTSLYRRVTVKTQPDPNDPKLRQIVTISDKGEAIIPATINLEFNILFDGPHIQNKRYSNSSKGWNNKCHYNNNNRDAEHQQNDGQNEINVDLSDLINLPIASDDNSNVPDLNFFD